LASGFDVAVLHDFFVDRLVKTGDMGRLFGRMRAKARIGGGGIHGVTQQDVRGGNTVNLAHALATLGLKTLLITHGDREHEAMLRAPFEGLEAEVRMKNLPPGLTVAVEERVNVMLGDSRGAGQFGPSLLSGDDWDSLARAKIVCEVNWAANSMGTQLASELRRRLGPRKTIFMDPADFRERLPEFRKLLGMIKDRHLVDWISLNAQEGSAASALLSIPSDGFEGTCRALAEKLGVMVDIHTADGSYTSSGARVYGKVRRRSKAMTLTGAGDVWDAASIYGRLSEMSDARRMDFADAAARLYVRSSGSNPPSLSQVLKEAG